MVGRFGLGQNQEVRRRPGVEKCAEVHDARTGLRTVLNAHTKLAHTVLRVAGEAHSVATAVAEAGRLQPDVVLMNIRLPDGSGLEACRKILAADSDTRILILTSVIDDALVYDAMSSGAHGYLLKDTAPELLVAAVRTVAGGGRTLGPSVELDRVSAPRGGPSPLDQLTDRERQLLGLLAQGLTNRDMAHRLSLSEKTVRNHVSAVLAKLPAATRAEAVALARDNGLGMQLT